MEWSVLHQCYLASIMMYISMPTSRTHTISSMTVTHELYNYTKVVYVPENRHKNLTGRALTYDWSLNSFIMVV